MKAHLAERLEGHCARRLAWIEVVFGPDAMALSASRRSVYLGRIATAEAMIVRYKTVHAHF
jgi:hypothetical protein